ncbi:MAG: DUF4112 domain-containing protein [Alphaproteobacteria bacterium]|nr:DUF4112 domain-containing protein [Alphaproteobacteria bacterium]MBV9371038.1 DUF4112 domain-containing protein [Alphaproteobacteria bacterium]MBV9901588.1 DUF4112 domain-containing protein [Alphaproteobacteria bacterium]
MPTTEDQFEAAVNRLPIGRDPASVRRRIEAMEVLLERLFTVPGLNRPIGLDVLLDVVPVVGDIVSTAMGAWIVWEARNLGMSKWHIARMSGNVGIDFLLGAIPWVGAIPDFFFRSNSRNLKIVKRYLDKHHPSTGTIEGQIVSRG